MAVSESLGVPCEPIGGGWGRAGGHPAQNPAGDGNDGDFCRLARGLEAASEGLEAGVVSAGDDNPANRKLLARRLTRSGYAPAVGESGEAVLELLAERRFDLILLQARISACLEKVRLRQNISRQFRVFISSPGDVIPERRIVKAVIGRLNEEFAGRAYLIPILREEEPMLASEATSEHPILNSAYEFPGQHDQAPEHTLTSPPNCPTKWDHLSAEGQLMSRSCRIDPCHPRESGDLGEILLRSPLSR